MFSSGQRNPVSSNEQQIPHRLDIVISHYHEAPEIVRPPLDIIKQLPVVSRLNPRVIVYTKGLATANITDIEILKEEIGADIVYELPNIGRETDTHLTHIVNYYDELAEFTLFLQGHIEYLDLIELMLTNHFRPTLGVMCLGSQTTCPCDYCIPDVNGAHDPIYGYKRIPQLHGIFNHRFCPPQGLLISFKSQFIVSRTRVTRHPKHKYEWLKELFNDMSHFVHDDNPEDVTSTQTPDDPLFGHTLERAWMIIFGCNDLRLHHECDRFYSGTRCACYDDDDEEYM